MPLSEVPDPVFAGAMVGPGLAIDPPRVPSEAVSPIDGTVVKLHPHAFVIADAAGAGVLVHLGIDTVQLRGEGFRLHVDEGADVRAGDTLISWDPAAVEAGGRSPVCPVVALDAAGDALSDFAAIGEIKPADPLFTWRR
jgi:glucose-specific phosphotransferase system IIA component